MKNHLYNLIQTKIKRIRGFPLELIDNNLSALMQEYDRRLPARIKPLEHVQKLLSETVPLLNSLATVQDPSDKKFEVATFLVGYNCLEMVEEEIETIQRRFHLLDVKLETKYELQNRLEECAISLQQIQKLHQCLSLPEKIAKVQAYYDVVNTKLSSF